MNRSGCQVVWGSDDDPTQPKESENISAPEKFSAKRKICWPQILAGVKHGGVNIGNVLCNWQRVAGQSGSLVK